MTEVSTFFGGNANVPAMNNVAKALQDVANEAGANLNSGGMPILKFSKGDWNYGASATDVEPKSEWAANPMSVRRGYVAWKDKRPIKTAMAAIGDAGIKLSDLDHDLGEHTTGQDKGKKVEWAECISVDFMCVSGEDEGTIVRYETTSYGGRAALTELTQEMARAAAQDPDVFIPVVVFGKDSYQHKEHGKTFTPVLDIREFVSAADLAGIEPVNAPEPEPEPEPAPKRSSRRKAKAEAEPEVEVLDAEEVEEVGDTPPPGRRRRRRS